MIVNDFIPPTTFYTGQFLSAPDIGTLISNVQYLDAMSYRREAVFDSMGKKGAPSSAWHHNDNGATGFLLWRGGLLFRVGYTTLTVRYRRVGALPGTARLRIFINGVLRSEIVPASGDGSIAIAIGALGFAEGQPLLIEVRTHGLSSTDRTSEWWVPYIYVTPAYIPPGGNPKAQPWPPLPSFNGTYAAADLNKLSAACTYLYERMNGVPIGPNRAHLFSIMSDKAEEFEVWSGSAAKYTSVDVFCVEGTITVLAATDTLKVYMNDVLKATLGPYSVGSHPFSASVAYPTGTTVPSRVRIKITCTTSANRLNSQCSRLSLLTLRTDPAGVSFPILTPPTTVTSGPLYSATTVNATLNRIASMLNAIKTRIDASSSFTSVRAVRDIFGYDNHARRSLDRFHPLTFQRRGSRLVLYGKNALLGFGGYTFELDDDGRATYKYKFNNEQTLIQGDKFELKTIYLDSIKGLFPGDLYYLIGDITWAGEYHK
jgi:hypothetical protein